MAEITATSKHSRTRQGQTDALGRHLGNTTLGHAQYAIAYGKKSNRRSKTMHCSHETARKEVESLTAAGL